MEIQTFVTSARANIFPLVIFSYEENAPKLESHTLIRTTLNPELDFFIHAEII